MARKKKKKRIWRKLFALALIGGMAGFAWVAYDLPSADDVRPLEVKPSITVLDREGGLIARYGGIKGAAVEIDDLPSTVKAAILSIEDRRFYEHFGIDPRGFARAMWANLKAGSFVQGGSTITQQLAKNLFLTPDKTLRRKAQEALLALAIERRYTKDEILSAYLNRVYFGAGAYGIDAAARTYFNKPATKLNLWESAVLAGVLKAPSRYSPAANPELAAKRAEIVISAMEDAGYISERRGQLEKTNARVHLASEESDHSARWFADWIVGRLDDDLTASGRDIVVRTTLDPRLQKILAQAQDEAFATAKAEDKVSQAAAVMLARDGAVLAMTGGRDYAQSQFNRATQAKRQPGSAFKPFVYIAALEAGFRPRDTVLDARITSGSYRPENYDGQYHGEVTLTDALAFSLNTAAVRLMSDVGAGRTVDVARRAGIQSKLKPELALALGASETTLLELTGGYAAIANGGYRVPPYAIAEISDIKGNIFYLHTERDHPRVFAPDTIRDIDSMLVQVVARGTGQAAQLTRGHVAGKTGTSQDHRDAWFIGYTDTLVLGVWTGNDDNSPMSRVSGGGFPARLWRSAMQQAIALSVPQASVGGEWQAPPPASRRTAGGSFSDLLNRMTSDIWNTGATPSQAPPKYNR